MEGDLKLQVDYRVHNMDTIYEKGLLGGWHLLSHVKATEFRIHKCKVQSHTLPRDIMRVLLPIW